MQIGPYTIISNKLREAKPYRDKTGFWGLYYHFTIYPMVVLSWPMEFLGPLAFFSMVFLLVAIVLGAPPSGPEQIPPDWALVLLDAAGVAGSYWCLKQCWRFFARFRQNVIVVELLLNTVGTLFAWLFWAFFAFPHLIG